MAWQTTYTPEIGQVICERMAKGETLASICRDDGFPNRATVYDWLAENPEFERRFARARHDGYDAIAEECFAIADDSSRDYDETENGPRLNAEHVQRSKLRVETRLKLLAKWSPKYCDRLQHDGNVGVTVQVVSFGADGGDKPQGA